MDVSGSSKRLEDSVAFSSDIESRSDGQNRQTSTVPHQYERGSDADSRANVDRCSESLR